MRPVDVVTFLREMIRFDTVNSEISGRDDAEAELVSWLESRAKQHGLSAELLPVPSSAANLLISFERDPSLPWLLFDSHLDTVSVDGMSIDPFSATVRDDRVWGRGACDTKASGAAMFAALTEYTEDPTGSHNIMLLFSVGEEVGMTGIKAFVSSGVLGKHHCRAAVVGEPTRLELVVATNGVERYVVSAKGVAAHSADPDRGVSAISTMAELVLYLEREYVPSLVTAHPLTGKAQASINLIQGGSAINVIPDLCEIRVDRRMVPGETSAGVAAEFERHLDQFRTAHGDAAIEMEPFTETPPLAPASNSAFVESVQTVLRDRRRPDSATGARFATHAGILCEAGIPSIVLGPGNIEQAHTKDEWIEVTQLQAAVPIYLEIMRLKTPTA